jgi:hypothetical protein
VAKQSLAGGTHPYRPEQAGVAWRVLDTLARLFSAGVQLYCHFVDRR